MEKKTYIIAGKKVELEPHNCEQCGADMNPGEWLLGPVCGKCCRENHRKVAGK